MVKAAPPEVSTIDFANPEERCVGLLLTEEEQIQQLLDWAEEDRLKLVRLAREVYEIPDGPEQFYLLALALARRQHPEKNKVGRPGKWKELNQGALVVEIERLLETRENLKSACFKLSKREPWKSFLAGTRAPDEVIRQVFINFREERWANVARKAFHLFELEGRIEDWDKYVCDVVLKS